MAWGLAPGSSATRPLPAKGQVDPFAGWTSQAPEAIDWETSAGAPAVEWFVRIENGRVAVGEPQEQEPPLPFQIEPIPRRGAVDLAGGRQVVAVEGGYLVGFNAGEFGGGVWWFSKDGRRRQKLTLRASESLDDYIAENLQAFVPLGREVLAFEGLTHGGSDDGRVVRLSRGPKGAWRPALFAQLDTCPHAVVEESP